MSEFGNEIILSASKRIGMPFRHHFKPTNLCEGETRTTDECMERGVDTAGYDCSGLAIVSLCDVLGISTARWPKELRHTQQLAKFTTDREYYPGDLRLYYSVNNTIHIGIATTTAEVIHASGISKKVEQSIVNSINGEFIKTRVIDPADLASIMQKYF